MEMNSLSPAALLHRQLTEWNQPDVIIRDARDDAELRMHRQCARWLDQIEDQIQRGGASMNVFARALPGWIETVFNYPLSWQSSYSKPVSQSHLDLLEAFIPISASLAPRIDADKLKSLRDYLSKVVDVAGAAEVTGATDHVAEAVATAARHLTDVIDEIESTGSVDFKRAFEAFLGQMVQCAQFVPQEKRGKFNAFIEQIVFPVITNTAGAVAGGFIQSALM